MIKKSPTKNKSDKRKLRNILFALVLTLVGLVLAGLLGLSLYLGQHSGLKTNVCGLDLSWQNRESLKKAFSNHLSLNYPQKIIVTKGSEEFYLHLSSLRYLISQNVNQIIPRPLISYRSIKLINPLEFLSQYQSESSRFLASYDSTELDNQIASASAYLSQPAVPPALGVAVSGKQKSITVTDSKPGMEVNADQLKRDLIDSLSCPNPEIRIPVVLKQTNPAISQEQIDHAQTRAEKLLNKKLAFTLEFRTWEIVDERLVEFLDFNGGFDDENISAYAEEIAQVVNRLPGNAVFQFENGKVTIFKPAEDGLELDKNLFIQSLKENLQKLEAEKSLASLPLPVRRTPPKVGNAEVNDLGVNELIGRGTSLFYGSIANRIYNLTLASQRLNGFLVAPGEEFSFNQAVGDINASTGYKQAYVIKQGRTILDDGGGVCQVSTTLFRAVLNAGLPVTERHAHAYRVHYYEADMGPGYDATVFAPTADFKFKNDTREHILIQTTVDKAKKQLVFELYGTKDNRVAEISKATVWDRVPALPDLYQDDPTLPVGTVKQVDWSAPGAKAKFSYKVTDNGEVLIDTEFYSNYRPWQAIYLRGTKAN